MSDNPRVEELLEEVFESGRSPEDVCAEWPELLDEVRERMARFALVRDELDAMFPAEGSTEAAPIALSRLGGGMPQVPGHEVEAVLGRGGMGIVYKARHLRLNRPVAVKMMLAGGYASPPELARFQREAEALAGLRHPNVVQIHDVGDIDGMPYFTMEFVEGGNLAQRLAGAPLPARQAAALSAVLAGAVQAAHRSGIVHRDLKPGNVLLTAEGTPKISDFGLARRLDSAAGLTRTGAAVGTPSYMAPEQARGKALVLGPAVDIYALGAILYEMLTGRPPFRAETALETLLQVMVQDPVPPSQLNSKVPRDLETICLKCLRRESHVRYATAGALAEDLDCFLRGEAIAARPERRWERFVRRVRRRPALSSAVVGVTLVILALVGAGLWLSAEREASRRRLRTEQAVIERAVEENLREMIRWEQMSAWTKASAELERAKARLGDRGSADLRRRLAQGARELELAARLDAIRLGRATRLGEKRAFTRSDEDYEAAFREAGLGKLLDASDVVASRVRASNLRQTLVAALDDWAACTVDPRRQGWVLAVARQADRDPTGWRTRARTSATWTAKESLAELTEAAPVDGESVPLLLALAEHMESIGADPVPFLTRVQHAHPDDFWANLSLAEVFMEQNNLPEATRFYQAAVALRPGASVVFDNLGLALALQGRMREADAQFRKASSIDPTAASAHNNLGIAFSTAARRDEAIDRSKLSPHFSHDVAALHTVIGDNLREQGKLAEAMDRYRQAIAIDPKLTSAQDGLRTILTRQGRFDELRLAWGRAIDADPPDYGAWDGYAELCLFLGQDDEYRRVRRALLDRFGATTDPQAAERIGRACLLMPAPAEELRTAESLVDRALAVDKTKLPEYAQPYYQFAKGLAEYRQGRLDRALAVMEGEASKVMGPSPRLVQAMVQHGQGRKGEALKTLAAAVLAFDWQPTHADHRDVWIYHIIRREAETLILPNLRAFVEGKYEPRNNDERLDLVDGCRYSNRPAASARLYAEAFAADPHLAEEPRSAHRYNAARAAALAGCGRGEDGARLGQEERTRWRQQARAWLELDLVAWTRKWDSGTAADRELVRQTLRGWLADPDLDGLRERGALGKLSTEEQAEWLALWKAVDALLSRTTNP